MKKPILISLALLCSFATIAQTTVNAPTTAWKSVTWAPHSQVTNQPQTQDESSEDWWYDHKNSFNSSNEHIGYVACGYSTWVGLNLTENDGCFECNEGSTSPKCNQLETSQNSTMQSRGCAKQTMAFFDLQGRMQWCRPFNSDAFFAVIQDGNGDYIAVGNSQSTKDLNGNPLVYNPPGNNQTFAPLLGSCTKGDNINHLSLVKVDADGNVIWNYLYGAIDYTGNGSAAYEATSWGYDLVETPDGGYVIDGNNSDNFDDQYLARLNVPCQKNIAYNDNTLLFVNDVATWSFSRKVIETVIIPAGKTLRIEGPFTKIEFADYRHYNDIDDITNNTLSVRPGIVVEPGGTLIIEDALLTGIEDPACTFPGMWEGIRVLGDFNASQQPASNQGQVLLNNATIKNAFAAVTLDDNFFNIDGLPINGSNAGGGILKATDSRFQNNYRDVVFGNHPSTNNPSFFVNCTLETTAPLVDPNLVDENGERLGTQHHIMAYGVNGVDVKGCTIRNTGTFNLGNRGTGIAAWDSRINVVPQCIQPGFPNCITEQPNRFENLYYGVYDAGVFPDKTIVVQRNEFTDVQRGITVRGKNTPVITGNNFAVGDGVAPKAYGIYLQEAFGYKVEENTFTGKELASNGIIAYNTGSLGNQLYKNDFTDLGTGIKMQGQPQLNSNSSLQIKCNNFFIDNTGQVADVGIASGIIHPLQGDNTCSKEKEMAGNQFSHTCSNNESDYLDNPKNQGFFYSHHADNGFTAPVCHASTLINNDCGFIFNSNSCPSELDKDENELKSNINSLSAEIVAKSNLVDGGDTNGLLELISTGSNGQVKNGLLNASPYLSDTVLLAYINSNPPNGHIKSVLLANSPLDSAIYAAVLELNLPNGIQNQIDAAQDGSLSPMDELALELGYLQGQRQINTNGLVQLYLSDTTITNGLDSAIAVLQNEPAVEYQCWLSSIHIANGNFTAAQAILDSLNGTAGLSAFCQFQQTALSIGIAGNFLVPVLKTDESLQALIAAFGTDSLTQGSVYARNALEAAFGFINEPNVEELTIPMMKTAGNSGDEEQEITEVKDPEILNLKPQRIVKVYPNPTNGSLTIENSSRTVANFSLYNLTGKNVQNTTLKANSKITLNIEVAEGMYLYLVTVNNSTIAREKLIITK